METIASEAYYNSNLVTDLDNFRGRNLEMDVANGLSVVYPSCEVYTFEQNLFRLLAESKKEEFKPDWTMRPDYTSFDMYKTTIFWHLLLFVNNVPSIEDYKNLEYVLVPSSSIIAELIRERVPRKEIQVVGGFSPISGIEMFQRKPFDNIEKNKIKGNEAIEAARGDIILVDTPSGDAPPSPVINERIEKYIVSAETISNQYIDLTSLPINGSSVSLYVGNFTVPQKYGYDYVLMGDDDSVFKRISWNPEVCFGGRSTLSNVMKDGLVLKIKYLTEETAE